MKPIKKKKIAANDGVTPGDFCYQFKITLEGAEPAVWRRIVVPDCTLAELHHFIQWAMGWTDSHLHQFEIDKRIYGVPHPDDEFHLIPETKTRLSDLIDLKSRKRPKWIYEYDFGDSWRHVVKFEGVHTADAAALPPICLDGARACPPEDCGGVWGYTDILKLLQKTDGLNRVEKQRLDWLGEFDPDAFDPKKATAAMKRVKTRRR